MVDLVKGVNAFVVAGSAKSTCSIKLPVILDKGMIFPYVLVNKNGRVPVREKWMCLKGKYSEKRVVICAAPEPAYFRDNLAPSIVMRAGDRIVENAYLFSSEEKLDEAIARQEYLKTPESIARNEANKDEYERYLHNKTYNRTYRW